MTGNEANNPAESELQRAFRKAIEEAAAEMQQVQGHAQAFRGALEFLKEKSRNKFGFREMPTGNSDLVLETRLLTTDDITADALRVRITAQGETFTNLPEDAAQAPPLTQDEPAPPADDVLAQQLARIKAKQAAEKEQREKEAYAARMTAMRALPQTVSTNTISNPADKMALLREIAERALFNDLVPFSLDEENKAATPEQEAVLDGLRRGAREIKVAQTAASGLAEGFRLLAEMSDGRIRFTPGKAAGTSDALLRISCSEANYKFPGLFYKVSALGEISIAPTVETLGKPDRNAVTDVEVLLVRRAEEATVAGLVSSASPDRPAEPTALQQLILDTIRKTEEEMTMAQMAADILTRELEELKRQTNGAFHYTKGEPNSDRSILITINPGTRASSQVTLDGNGMMKVEKNAEGCSIFDEAAVAAALIPLIKEAVYKGQVPLPLHNQKPSAPGL